MPSPAELCLSSLLPTLSPLPPDLLQLSHSLLAQSRARASSLKPDEEIARTYACCHIACERLGKRLALELARPSPPCPPKVYQRLKTYLGSVLRTPGTPSGGRAGRAEDERGRSGSAAGTPVIGRSDTRVVSTVATPTGRSQGAKTTDRNQQATPTTQDQDRGSTLRSKRKADEDPAEAQLRLEAAQAGGAAPDAAGEGVRPATGPSKTPLRRQEKHARRRYGSAKPGEDEVGPSGLQVGLGTMFQNAVDWLSEERREEYARWEEEILRECAEMERGMQGREVDAVG
ncbi:Origin recognition complex subunit 6 (ORC6) [Teratosphaeria destructans]|uniref:Origin recognition complex subunit 6 (ORC6) n=1 Tax=Teratosphaeria destructans TaxID=418781 RepID=A0A9W7W2X0_9PEZI|nr:Origin recognition complex subunit 6 (ORC6) [Teratosphaeria destructans]